MRLQLRSSSVQAAFKVRSAHSAFKRSRYEKTPTILRYDSSAVQLPFDYRSTTIPSGLQARIKCYLNARRRACMYLTPITNVTMDVFDHVTSMNVLDRDHERNRECARSLSKYLNATGLL